MITPPKTGSVSITQSLFEVADIHSLVHQRGDCFDFNDEFGENSKHIQIDEIYNQWNKTHLNFDEYLKIGTVRNPWSRIVSWYHWQRRYDLDFSECLVEKADELSWLLDKPQLDYFEIKKSNVMDHYIRFENFQEEFDAVCEKIGIPPRKLPHKNKTSHRPYWEYYDEYTKNLIEIKFAADIEHFGYEFGKY